MRKLLLPAGAILVGIALAACQNSNSEPAKAAEPAPAEGAAAEPTSAKPFGEMSAGEKMSHMKKVVLPGMKPLLGAEEGEEYSCKTCHGDRAANGDFSMPNPGLPPLDPSDGFADEKKEHPEAVQFMMEKVVPKMAELLGEHPYDPATGEGFGCFECHTKTQ
jgi:hypothetical protein